MVVVLVLVFRIRFTSLLSSSFPPRTGPLGTPLELIWRRWKYEGSSSFSEDSSLLVVVSRLARALTASTAPSEPRLKRLSIDRLEGEVTRSSGPSLRSEPRIGDESDLCRTGIFANLICWTALCAPSASSSLSSLRSLLSSSSICSLLRRRFAAVGPGAIVSLVVPPVTMAPSSSSSPNDVDR